MAHHAPPDRHRPAVYQGQAPYTAGVRETLAQHPDYFDPRQYGKVARKYMTEMYSHKIIDVLGSDHKLINCD